MNRGDTCTDAVRKKRGRPENSGKPKKTTVELKFRSRPLLPNSQKPILFPLQNNSNPVPVISQLVPKIIMPPVNIPVPHEMEKLNFNLNEEKNDLEYNQQPQQQQESNSQQELMMVPDTLDIDETTIEILKKWLPKIQNNPGEFANVTNPQDFDELVLTFATLQKLQGNLILIIKKAFQMV